MLLSFLHFLTLIHSAVRLRQVLTLFQSQFTTQCDRVLRFFNLQYPLVSLKSSSSCLPPLPRRHITSILPSIFPQVTCFTKQYLRKMRPFHSALLPITACKIFLLSSLCMTLFISHTTVFSDKVL
jgi:hypothetical protein